MRPPDGVSSRYAALRHEVARAQLLLHGTKLHIPNDCAAPSVEHSLPTAGVDKGSASGPAPASISTPTCAPADVIKLEISILTSQYAEI